MDLSGFPFEKVGMLKELAGSWPDLFYITSQIRNIAPEQLYFWAGGRAAEPADSRLALERLQKKNADRQTHCVRKVAHDLAVAGSDLVPALKR